MDSSCDVHMMNSCVSLVAVAVSLRSYRSPKSQAASDEQYVLSKIFFCGVEAEACAIYCAVSIDQTCQQFAACLFIAVFVGVRNVLVVDNSETAEVVHDVTTNVQRVACPGITYRSFQATGFSLCLPPLKQLGRLRLA